MRLLEVNPTILIKVLLVRSRWSPLALLVRKTWVPTLELIKLNKLFGSSSSGKELRNKNSKLGLSNESSSESKKWRPNGRPRRLKERNNSWKAWVRSLSSSRKYAVKLLIFKDARRESFSLKKSSNIRSLRSAASSLSKKRRLWTLRKDLKKRD